MLNEVMAKALAGIIFWPWKNCINNYFCYQGHNINIVGDKLEPQAAKETIK